MTTTGDDPSFVRAVSALVALVAVVIGVPVALTVVVGWPLPTVRPDPGAVLEALRHGGVARWTFVKVVACLVWVAWLPTTVAVMREVAARNRRLPGGGALQRAVASLVAAAGMVGGAVTSLRPAAALPLAETLDPVRFTTTTTVPTTDDAASPVVIGAAESPATVPYTVRPRDTLWGIAARVLGDGSRWEDLARLNEGRNVAPGVVFGPDVERLRPGWVLAVPAPTVEVAPGDTLWAIAERAYGDGTAWPRLWEANQGRRFGARVFTDPNLIHPGWHLVVPPAGPGPDEPEPPAAQAAPDTPPPAPAAVPTAPAPSTTVARALPCPAVPDPDVVAATGTAPTTAPTAATTAGATTGAAPAGTLPRPTSPLEPPTGSPLLAAVAPAGLGGLLVAGGAASLVARRRRRQARRAPAGHRLPRPDPDLHALRAAIAETGAVERLARLEVALRSLAARVGRTSAARATVVLVHDTGDIEVLLDGAPGDLPTGWRVGTGADRLVLPAGTTLRELASELDGVAPPCPALAHLGRADTGEVFVDLEAVGTLAVDGPGAPGVVRAVLAGLAVTPLAAALDIVVYGIEPWGLETGRVEAVAADALDARCSARSGPLLAALYASGAPSTFALRARHGEEAWAPIVAVATNDVPTGPGIAALCVGGPAPWRLAPVPGGRWRLTPVGIDLTPVALTHDGLADVAAVLRDADRPAEPVGALPVPDPDRRLPEPVTAIDGTPAGSGPVLRVLGGVELLDADGEVVEVERAKALELLVWLALHRHRPHRREARAALWSVEVADGTFHNVVSEARRALARAVPPPPGREWLPARPEPTFALDPAVTTDLDRFRALSRVGDAAGAVDLVRGRPFAGVTWSWLDAEAHQLDVTLEVVDVIAGLAASHLAAGRIEDAFVTSARGLALLPGHERLVELRLRAHAAAGNRVGLRRELEAYERVVTTDGCDPSPSLVALSATLARAVAGPGA
jgi:nucleoid-associated protein YgaU/DNA-binding SARP family transcriptional activator